MVMRDREIKDRYVRKDVTIKILAELNACDEEDIRRILKKQGVDVPKKERKKGGRRLRHGRNAPRNVLRPAGREPT